MKNVLFTSIAMFVFIPMILMANIGRILVENTDGGSSLHESFQSAINTANHGATIYLPAGYWNENVTISKRLTIYGVGHFPNSSPVSPGTSRVSSITFSGDNDSTVIQGLIIDGTLLHNSASKHHYYLRCKIGALNLATWGIVSTTNHIIKECAIQALFTYSAKAPQNIVVTNCYIDYIGGFDGQNIYFVNNIIGPNNNFQYGASKNLLIENCIFTGAKADHFTNLSSSIINNCIFVSATVNWGSNSGDNNILGQSCNDIFVDSDCAEFSYTSDYHLDADSPGKDAGTDGKDIGIYGGDSPFKENGLPFTPQIKEFSVSRNPVDGKIQVNATAVSQTK
ncbi:MAG: hypothetical protein M9949_12405 [Candidatus Kapabacteria bacterium]|nr:hypothetical protein [Candidatus Kapabacteria bacterium]